MYLVNPNVVVVVPKVLKMRRSVVEITMLHCEQFEVVLQMNVCYLWYVITGNLNWAKVEIVER